MNRTQALNNYFKLMEIAADLDRDGFSDNAINTRRIAFEISRLYELTEKEISSGFPEDSGVR